MKQYKCLVCGKTCWGKHCRKCYTKTKRGARKLGTPYKFRKTVVFLPKDELFNLEKKIMKELETNKNT